MQANRLLTIVIPTYNRGDFLDQCLEVNLPLASAYDIAIAILDNASTDHTAEVVQKHAKQYPLLTYHRHEHNVGVEENVVLSLKHPETEYVWILADNYQIPEQGIDYVIERISTGKGYDAVVLNLPQQKKDVATRDFTDGNELLSSIGSVMTCLSCLIISRKVIENSDFQRYRESRFVQTGIIFDSIGSRPFIVHFAQSVSMSNLVNFKENKNAWSKSPIVFEIACQCWVNFVYSLPFCYSLESKQRCILDLTEVSTIFSLSHMLFLRMAGVFDYRVYRKYCHLFPLTIKLPGWLILMIALTPAWLLRTLHALKRGLKGAAMVFLKREAGFLSSAGLAVCEQINHKKASIS